MAKLNVVIPAVEVTVDGVAYRKVDRKAQAGDIVKMLRSGYGYNHGDYFAVDVNLKFFDNDGGKRSITHRINAEHEVYAPISESTTQSSTDTITFEGAEWRRVDRDVREGDAIRFTDDDRSSYLTEADLYVVDRIDSCDDPQITDDDGDEYDAGGEDYEVYEKVTESATPQYREVKRKANVGERIKIVARHECEVHYGNGAEFIVVRDAGDGDVRVNTERVKERLVLHREYVVLEPVNAEPAKKAEPERLSVGDYARFVKDGATVMKTGDIVEITEVDSSSVPYRTKRLTDGAEAWASVSKLVRATDEEVAAAKDPRSQFAVGDKVRLVSGGSDFPLRGFTDGGIYTVNNPKVGSHDNARVEIKRASGNTGYALPSEIVKLTAEEVAEIERKQAEEAKWNAIGRKVNELKDGDIVRFTELTGAAGYTIGSITEIRNVRGQRFDFGGIFGGHVQWCELVTPVEQRFDRAEEVDAA
nr:hypothetical protein [Paenibacillus xylanexedens]